MDNEKRFFILKTFQNRNPHTLLSIVENPKGSFLLSYNLVVNIEEPYKVVYTISNFLAELSMNYNINLVFLTILLQQVTIFFTISERKVK
jgi:hypothetical protein